MDEQEQEVHRSMSSQDSAIDVSPPTPFKQTEDVAAPFTTPPNVLKRKHQAAEVDLTADDDSDPPPTSNRSRAALYEQPETETPSRPERQKTSTNESTARLMPPHTSPDQTLIKAEKRVPTELANRYVSKVRDEIVLRNPSKFCLKPPFWRRWDARRYKDLAEYLRAKIDLAPFAVEQDLSVEEVQTVFTALVYNPLSSAAIASRRGEEGMQEIFALYNQFGMQTRTWGKQKDGEKLQAELASVEVGVVVLTGTTGNKHCMKLDSLSPEDVVYLSQTLTTGDKRILHRCNEVDYLREWARTKHDGTKIKAQAELLGVEPGIVVLNVVGTTQRIRRIRMEELAKEDVEYLRKTLTAQEKLTLWDSEVASVAR